MRFCFIKRPAISVVKLGRFLIGASLAFSVGGQSDESNFFTKPSAEIRFGARPLATGPVYDTVFGRPALGMASLLANYQPLPELTVNVSAFGRVPVQAGNPTVDAFVSLDDSYIKLKQPSFTFSLGYLRTPWKVLRGSAVNDRINPIDYRRGIDFPKDDSGRLPQWGMQLSGRFQGVSLEGIYHFWRRPNPASRVAIEQDGVQIGHYQGALAMTQQDLATLIPFPIVERELPWFSQPTIAIAARKEFDDVQTGLNLVWGFSEVPMLVKTSFDDTVVASSTRSLSFGGEVAATLGVVILKAEAVLTPKLDESTGKATLLGVAPNQNSSGIGTHQMTSATAALGVEGEYGDTLSASLELLETAWFNVPPQYYVYAVETTDAATGDYRFAQRLALALVLDGKLFDNFLSWAFRGEFGLTKPDLLSTINLRHEFTDTGFSVGAYANLFFGPSGTPGGFRNAATECGLSFGYRL